MLQQDYLMRMFTALAIAMRESMLRAQGDEDPEGAAELLVSALDKTTEIDGALLLQMAPESFVAMVQLSQTDPALIGYISRTLMLESHYLSEAGLHERATLRAGQAQALMASNWVQPISPLKSSIDSLKSRMSIRLTHRIPRRLPRARVFIRAVPIVGK